MSAVSRRIVMILAALLTLSSCKAGDKPVDFDFSGNEIRLGEAQISVDFSAPNPQDSIYVMVFWNPLLDNLMSGKIWAQPMPVVLEQDGSTWAGTVPMETKWKNNVQMLIRSQSGNIMVPVSIGIAQDSPLKLNIDLAADGSIKSLTHSGGTGLVDTGKKYQKIYNTFGFSYEGSKDIYEDCFKFRQWELETMLPENISSAMKGLSFTPKEETWVKNELTRALFAGRLMQYEDIAKSFGVDLCGVDTTKISAPPIEYYEFLNELDYSSMLLDELFPNLRIFTNSILYDPTLAIQPIGETPIGQWQSEVKTTLGKVMDNPAQLLIDLLTITSYFEQIQTQATPLTQVQINEIESFYGSSDIGKLILSRNNNPYPAAQIIDFQ